MFWKLGDLADMFYNVGIRQAEERKRFAAKAGPANPSNAQPSAPAPETGDASVSENPPIENGAPPHA